MADAAVRLSTSRRSPGGSRQAWADARCVTSGPRSAPCGWPPIGVWRPPCRASGGAAGARMKDREGPMSCGCRRARAWNVRRWVRGGIWIAGRGISDACLASCGADERPGSIGARASPGGHGCSATRSSPLIACLRPLRLADPAIPARSTRPRPVARLIRARFPAAEPDTRRRADPRSRGARTCSAIGRSASRTNTGGAIGLAREPVHGRRAPWPLDRVPYSDPAIGDHKIIWEPTGTGIG